MASINRRGNVWWAKSYRAGRMVRQSLGTKDRAEAMRRLRETDSHVEARCAKERILRGPAIRGRCAGVAGGPGRESRLRVRVAHRFGGANLNASASQSTGWCIEAGAGNDEESRRMPGLLNAEAVGRTRQGGPLSGSRAASFRGCSRHLMGRIEANAGKAS
jgi:hypothetical protein